MTPDTQAAYTDPPAMPEDERMTDAEFRMVREWLGVTGDWLAGYLKVNPRTVRSWEQGRLPIPDGARLAIEELETFTGQVVGEAVAQLNDARDPAVVIYRNDTEYHAAHPEMTAWPASWHRMIVARAVQEVPGVVVAYANLS